MSLKLYRRHRVECEAGHAEDVRTGEFEESRRGWKRCACLIHASGTIGGVFRRKQTGQWTWEDAKAVASEWQAAGSWEGSGAVDLPPRETSQPETGPPRVLVTSAVERFLRELSSHTAPNTQKKYRLLMKKLEAFAAHRGFVMIDQWTPSDVREFRAGWQVSLQTAAKNMSTIKAFFEFCVANEWLARNPARLVKNQRGREAGDKRNEQKLPFTDDELQRMYAACEHQYARHSLDASDDGPLNRRYRWTGQDLIDFITVSVYTGLRISDVSTFHIDRLQPTGEIRIRTTKAGTHVYTWIPEWLQQRLRQRAERWGPHVFGEHQTGDLNVITDGWRRKLIRLWTLCGPWEVKPTPHRFRHTFARILLQRPGVTVRDVAELLGNSEAIVRKHYAAWIPERQERLTAVLKAAFSDRLQPKVVSIENALTARNAG
jgi:integrase